MWGRRVLLVVIISMLTAIVLGLAGVFEVTRPPLPPDLPDRPCPPSVTSDDVPDRTVYTGRAAPYVGAGPHPTIVLGGEGGPEYVTGPVWNPYQGYGLFPRDLIDTFPDDDKSALRIQLIGCVYGPQTTGSLAPYHCNYRGNPHDVPLLESTFVVRLYEARTSKPVAEFPIAGGCPPRAFLNESGPLDGYLYSGDLDLPLRPYIQATVPG